MNEKKFYDLSFYFLPLIAYYFAIQTINNMQNEYISIVNILVIILVIGVAIFNFYKANSNKLYGEKILQASSIILTIILFYLLFKMSIYVGAFVVAIIFSILLHEIGHLIMAIRNGIKVSEFSIGFGRPLFTISCCGINWKFQNILLGGYVKMVDDDLQNILKENKSNTVNLSRELERKGLKLTDLYLFKNLGQKIQVLLGGVMMNILIAYFSIVGIFLLLGQVKTVNTNNNLTKKQVEYIKKIEREKEKDKDLIKYLNEKVGQTMWLGNKKIDKEDIIANTFTETIKGSQLVFYSFIYAVTHPEYFMKFQSVVGVGKEINNQAQVGLMNWTFLLIIIALVNISLFVFNLLPFPALDGGQIVKEIVAHILSLGKQEYYINIILSKYIGIIDYLGFAILTGYGMILVFKDILI